MKTIILRLVASIRQYASRLKVRKNIIANRITKILFTKSPVKYADMAFYMEVYAHIFRHMDKIESACLKDKEVRKMVTTLVGNVVQDLANRINEFSNVVEATGKNEQLVEAFEEINDSVTTMINNHFMAKGKKPKTEFNA